MNDTQVNTVHNEHRSPAQYVMIAAILVALTAIEIVLYYSESSFSKGFVVAALLVVSATKFILVAGFFMHLKDDDKIFRRWFIIAGFVMVAVFIAVLASLSFQDHRFF